MNTIHRTCQQPSKKTQAVLVGGVIESVIGKLGYIKNYHGWQVVTRWPDIVGEHYARHTRAYKFEDGVVYVAVNDDLWRQKLSLDSEMILEKIRGQSFGKSVRKLRLVRQQKGTAPHGD
jgi:predicted nucleic acid-binding Zn ribbon protein